MDFTANDPHFAQCFDLANLMYFYMPINPYRRFLGDIPRREYLTGLCVYYFVLFSQVLLILLYALFVLDAIVNDGEFLAYIATSVWLVLAVAALLYTWCTFEVGQDVADLIALLYEAFPKSREESAEVDAENWTRDWANKMIVQRNVFVTAIIGMLISPFIRSMVRFAKSGQWENGQPLLIWLPFDPLVMPIYPVVYVVEAWFLLVNTCITVATEAAVGAVAVLICLQFKKVALQFQSIKFGNYNADLKSLIRVMQLHSKTLELAKTARKTFSIILFITYLTASMVVCIFVFLIVNENDFVNNVQYLVNLVCFLFYVAMFGYYGNLVIEYVSEEK